eukprot:scaffold239803_cov31-Tisochrysis_lutea.AAC.3
MNGPARVSEPAQCADQEKRGVCVQPSGRLIEKEDGRRCHELHAHGNTARLPARDAAARRAANARIGHLAQVEVLDHLLDSSRLFVYRLRAAWQTELCCVGEHLTHGKGLEERIKLHDIGRDALEVSPATRHAVDKDAARGEPGVLAVCEHVEQRGLAATRWPLVQDAGCTASVGVKPADHRGERSPSGAGGSAAARTHHDSGEGTWGKHARDTLQDVLEVPVGRPGQAMGQCLLRARPSAGIQLDRIVDVREGQLRHRLNLGLARGAVLTSGRRRECAAPRPAQADDGDAQDELDGEPGGPRLARLDRALKEGEAWVAERAIGLGGLGEGVDLELEETGEVLRRVDQPAPHVGRGPRVCELCSERAAERGLRPERVVEREALAGSKPVGEAARRDDGA